MLVQRICMLSVALLCGQSWAWDHTGKDVLQTHLAGEAPVLVAFIKESEADAQTELKSGALQKEWVAAVTRAKSQLRSVNCSAEEALCSEYDIISYPTLRLFEHGKPVTDYLGPRTSSGIVNFKSRHSRPAVTSLREMESIEQFKSADEVIFIGYISPNDEVSQQLFTEAAVGYRDEFSFALVSDEELIQAQNIVAPAIMCHIVGDEATRSFNNFAEAGALRTFVAEASRRVIGELTPYNYQRLHQRGWPMIYLFAETENDRRELRETLFKSVKGNYESLTCVTVDHLDYPQLQSELGLEPGVFPAGAVHRLATNAIYPYPRGLPIDSRSLQKWGLDVWQGRVKPWTSDGQDKTADQPAQKPGRAATRKVSMANFPGVNIRVGGRDEL